MDRKTIYSIFILAAILVIIVCIIWIIGTVQEWISEPTDVRQRDEMLKDLDEISSSLEMIAKDLKGFVG